MCVHVHPSIHASACQLRARASRVAAFTLTCQIQRDGDLRWHHQLGVGRLTSQDGEQVVPSQVAQLQFVAHEATRGCRVAFIDDFTATPPLHARQWVSCRNRRTQKWACESSAGPVHATQSGTLTSLCLADKQQVMALLIRADDAFQSLALSIQNYLLSNCISCRLPGGAESNFAYRFRGRNCGSRHAKAEVRVRVEWKATRNKS